MSLLSRSHAARKLGVLAAASVLVLGACSSDDDSSDESTTTTAAADESSTTTEASGGGESAETKRFDEEIQQWLIDVGCYSGSIDGEVGPETDAAIVAFQTAEGLTADGEVGTQTEAALKAAAEAGTQVCGGESGSTSTTAAGGSTSTTATPAGATCTATSLSAAVGATVNQYACAGGYAGVEYGTEADQQSVLEVQGDEWVDVTSEVCGAASAGIDPKVLEIGCSAS